MGRAAWILSFFLAQGRHFYSRQVNLKLSLRVKPRSLKKEYALAVSFDQQNRKVIKNLIDDYDIQLYLEDDIKFTKANLNYWLKYHEIVSKKGYNLGFCRIEYNGSQKLITDLTDKLTKIITIEDSNYLINDNNPYCGF